MTAPKSSYPSLTREQLEKMPAEQLLNVIDVAGLLKVSRSTVDEWRDNGQPPPAVSLAGMPRYRVGDLRAFIDELPVWKSRGPVNGQVPPAEVGKKKIDLFGGPMRRGRRSKAVDALVEADYIHSFEEWLRYADAETPWRFLLVRIELAPHLDGVLPVDLLSNLARDWKEGELLDWKELTLSGYAEAMRSYAELVRIADHDDKLRSVPTTAKSPTGEEPRL